MIPNTTPTYLSNLTPLRGIAALLTVIFHVDLELGMDGNLLLKFEDSILISRLYLMVDFFFILSSFVMCHVYGRWFQDSVRWPDFRQFTLARFARVYPLHVAMLLLTALIWGCAGAVPKPDMLTGWLICLAFIALTLLAASLTYRFIEVPARKVLNAQFKKRPITASIV
jgi:peptidoglycan/LPS O-acetylase OafA/YrhL